MKACIALAPLALILLSAGNEAEARRPMVFGGKLPLTRGVTSVEGGAGAGLATWALIAGNETEDGVGGAAFYTAIPLSDYDFSAYGVSIGLFDRVELSIARQEFDTGETGAALGLGEGFTFQQDVIGLKVRVAGDALYDQDRWLPQIAVGVQYKQAEHAALLSALGAREDSDVDIYVSATKILLGRSLVLNATARATRGNQFGLLGFGGDDESGRSLQWEVSGAYLVTDRLLLGAEYRSRPDNLGFADEQDGFDVFAAFAVTDTVSLVGGYVDLGSIATFDDQSGAYLSLQLGF